MGEASVPLRRNRDFMLLWGGETLSELGSQLSLGLIVAVAELVTPVTNSIVVSYRVALAPDRLQGRVQAVSTLISFSAGWLGPLFVGFMLQDAGSTATILAISGWALFLASVAILTPAFRHPPNLDDPDVLNPKAPILAA